MESHRESDYDSDYEDHFSASTWDLFVPSAGLHGDDEWSKVDVVPVAGKALGVVASANITAGTRILSEVPLTSLEDTGVNSVLTAFERIPPGKREEYLSLACTVSYWVMEHPTEEEEHVRKILNIHSTNVWDLTKEFVGVLARGSRFNHSCTPNVDLHWNSINSRMNFHVNRDIPAGQELTVSYMMTTLLSREARKQQLQHWNFDCTCLVCGDDAEAKLWEAQRQLLVAETISLQEARSEASTAADLQRIAKHQSAIVSHLRGMGVITFNYLRECRRLVRAYTRSHNYEAAAEAHQEYRRVLVILVGKDHPWYIRGTSGRKRTTGDCGLRPGID